jgi:hypothetical protein
MWDLGRIQRCREEPGNHWVYNSHCMQVIVVGRRLRNTHQRRPEENLTAWDKEAHKRRYCTTRERVTVIS